MAPINSNMSKDVMKSYAGKSLKFGTSTNISKNQNNYTGVVTDTYTPTSSASNKVNIKGSLIAKK